MRIEENKSVCAISMIAFAEALLRLPEIFTLLAETAEAFEPVASFNAFKFSRLSDSKSIIQTLKSSTLESASDCVMFVYVFT